MAFAKAARSIAMKTRYYRWDEKLDIPDGDIAKRKLPSRIFLQKMTTNNRLWDGRLQKRKQTDNVGYRLSVGSTQLPNP